MTYTNPKKHFGLTFDQKWNSGGILKCLKYNPGVALELKEVFHVDEHEDSCHFCPVGFDSFKLNK